LSPKNSLSGASLALVAILSAPLAGRAADKTVLRPVLDVEQGWDSNVIASQNHDEGSAITRINPGLWIENSGERGHALLGLNAIGRQVWSDSKLSGIDSRVRGDFERHLTPRFSLLGNGVLEYFSGYEEIRDDSPTSSDPSGLPGDVILAEQPSWKRDQIGAGFRYMLTPRLTLRLNGSAGRVNYEQLGATSSSSGEYRDRSLLGARGMLQYQLTALDQLSLLLNTDDTSYQDIGTGTNDSEIWNTQVAWTRTWSPVWSSSVSIGVRSIDATQKDVPQSGGSVLGTVPLAAKSFSSSGTGLIGSLIIQRTFERSALRLAYDRDTRSTGGSGRTNFDIDSFTLSLTHQLAARVKLTLSGDYSLYHSVTDEMPNYAAQVSGTSAFCVFGGAPAIAGYQSFAGFNFPVYQCVGGSSEETRDYTSLLARVDWQMRTRLNGYFVARYYKALTDQTLGSGIDIQTEDINKLTVGVGFRYFWDLDL